MRNVIRQILSASAAVAFTAFVPGLAVAQDLTGEGVLENDEGGVLLPDEPLEDEQGAFQQPDIIEDQEGARTEDEGRFEEPGLERDEGLIEEPGLEQDEGRFEEPGLEQDEGFFGEDEGAIDDNRLEPGLDDEGAFGEDEGVFEDDGGFETEPGLGGAAERDL